jgi:hypothetical protein
MFCKNCGAKIPDNTKFCGDCGSIVSEDNNHNSQSHAPDKNRNQKKGFKGGFALVIAVCFIVFGVALLIKSYGTDMLMPRKNDQQIFNEAYKEMNDEIDSIENKFADNQGYIDENDKDEVIGDVLTYAQSQLEQGNISYYEEGIDSVYMELPGDIGYVYIPKIQGSDIGAGEYSIATMQPCESGYPDFIKEDMKAVDDSAERVQMYTGNIIFDNSGADDDNYNNEEVILDVLLNISDYRIIIWHGHGTYTDTRGSMLVTGIKYSLRFGLDHIDDFLYKRFVVTNGGDVMITKDFFDYYIEDDALDGAIIYLGTCSSGADRRLAGVLIDKGAYSVYANSGTIHTVYNLSMIESVFYYLCASEGDDLNTTREALMLAKSANGAFDFAPHENTAVVLYENSDHMNSALLPDTLLPDDITSLMKTNYFMGKTYSGYYTYNTDNVPIPFTITFNNQSYNSIEGTIIDEEDGKAAFYGSINGNDGVFFFNKDYDDPQYIHNIQYNGYINLELGLMLGTWERSDGAMGEFSINID